MLLICRECPLLNYHATILPLTMLTYSPVNTIHIHHNGHGHFVVSPSSPVGKVKIYDSLNLTPTQELLDQIKAVYSVDSSLPEIGRVFISATQNGNVDCGIFAIVYAIDIAAENNPTTFVYDQREMRQHLLECLQNHIMKPFPRFKTLTNQVPLVDITKVIDSTQKWVTPRKYAKRKTCTDDFSTKNRYALLTNQTDNADFST